MQERLNCPNCGAPITSEKCEYCGTLFYDFANIAYDEVGYFRMKIGEALIVFKAVPRVIDVEQNCEVVGVGFKYGKRPLYAMPETAIRLELEVVTDEENLFKFYKKF